MYVLKIVELHSILKVNKDENQELSNQVKELSKQLGNNIFLISRKEMDKLTKYNLLFPGRVLTRLFGGRGAASSPLRQGHRPAPGPHHQR